MSRAAECPFESCSCAPARCMVFLGWLLLVTTQAIVTGISLFISVGSHRHLVWQHGDQCTGLASVVSVVGSSLSTPKAAPPPCSPRRSRSPPPLPARASDLGVSSPLSLNLPMPTSWTNSPDGINEEIGPPPPRRMANCFGKLHATFYLVAAAYRLLSGAAAAAAVWLEMSSACF